MHDCAPFQASEHSSAAARANRFELACDTLSSSDDILRLAQETPGDRLVLLHVSPQADASARRAICAAYDGLKQSGRRVRVLVNLPATADGTEVFRGDGAIIHEVLRLTSDLSGVGADLCWAIPLTADGVWRLDSLFSLAATENVQAILAPSYASLPDEAQLFAWDFVTYYLLEEAKSRLTGPELAYYQALQEELYHNRLGPSDAASPFGALLTDALAARTTQTDAPAGAAPLDGAAELAMDGVRAHTGALLSGLRGARELPARFETAVLVGAYGGEHVGDIAILGGVLKRMHEEFGLREAVLMTQRPNHTRHLVGNLETDVSLTVVEYTFPEISKHLSTREALIHAGGPLTDIPKQLVRHLYAASLAKRSGKPFIMEGIGPTTFKRAPSRVTARRLVKLADRITVRTKDDATRPVIQGLDFNVSHCPAFDYLKTRGPELTRLAPGEVAQIDALLSGSEGRPIVGINIRPINDLFTPTAAGRDKAAFTREVEDRMERNLAKGLARFAAESETAPIFVFFPMNAIQFGKSDNRSAFRITRHLPADIDARVWHYDASLDAVIALIRRMDTVISMRFHATIFALSQNCLPIGVDYRIGQKYKVTGVMEDAGEAEFCCRIDEVKEDWIADRLKHRIAARRSA